MRLILAALLVTGCTSAPAFEGYAKAYEINSMLNAGDVYLYADKPRGHQPKVMQPGDEGNCADFAVTKCAMLVRAGFAPKRLTLRKFTRTDGQDHAVCVVDEEWALDWRDHAKPLTKRALGAVTPLYIYTPAVAWK